MAGADTLVLGCTHYPFLIKKIKALYGDHFNIVDTSEAIIRQMRRLIPDIDASSSLKNGRAGTIHFYSTLDGAGLLEQSQKLMHSDLNGHEVSFSTVTIAS